MGIRFLCPNGHKLNVKAFLAGKKAVCPKCGEKVLVPEQSELGTAGKRTSPQARYPQAAIPQPIAVTASAPGGAVTAAPVYERPLSVQPNLQPMQPAFAPQPTLSLPSAPPACAAVDPITEAPTAVWYVRPPSGGQFGPASGDIMRGWLAEGRVTADSLVWRAGWPDWRSAASTFPQLFGGMAPVTVVPATAGPLLVGVAPVVAPGVPSGLPMGHLVGLPFDESATLEYEDPVARTRHRSKKGADATLVVSGILLALVIILFVILGIVLSQPRPEDEKPAAPKAKLKPAATSLEKPAKVFDPQEPKVQPLEGDPSPRRSKEDAPLEAEMTH